MYATYITNVAKGSKLKLAFQRDFIEGQIRKTNDHETSEWPLRGSYFRTANDRTWPAGAAGGRNRRPPTHRDTLRTPVNFGNREGQNSTTTPLRFLN